MHKIADHLAKVTARIARAASEAGRDPGQVGLIAVSKTRSAAEIEQAYRLGLRRFGENYPREGVSKIRQLAQLPDIEWHCIGPIQSNKSRMVAENFAWVHSLDRIRLARRLSEQRPEQLPPLQVCLQVNLDGEDTKSGVALAELPDLAQQVAALPRLRLRGLMAIPAPREEYNAQRASLARLRRALEELNATELPPLDTLSMGMSDDLEAAVAEGATLVRVGTAIFGPRTAKTTGETP